MEKTFQSLSNVSDTMLITLFARAMETHSQNPIIRDPKAVEIIESFKQDFIHSTHPIHQKILKGTYNAKLAVSMALRCRRFDRYVLDFLQRNPKSTVVNLGCGLDTRFDRIDNGEVTWFDLDFPSVIELRRRFMEESPRRHFISTSILDSGWINQVKTAGPYLVLAEGVFMYLKEEEVKSLLSMLKQGLGSVELVAEVSNLFWVKKMNSGYMQWKFKHQLGINRDAVFSFGIPESRYFESYSSDYKFLDEWTYFDDGEKKLGWYNIFSKIELLRMVQWTVHYQIG